jgi:hypothetical protein
VVSISMKELTIFFEEFKTLLSKHFDFTRPNSTPF